jgi:biotin carboxyl carrier protein
VTPAKPVRGEELEVPERVIVAPAVGVFQPLASGATPEAQEQGAQLDSMSEGEMVAEGQVVGVVEARGQVHPVRSAFTGFLMGMLAHPGERVREGQPVAWIRAV